MVISQENPGPDQIYGGVWYLGGERDIAIREAFVSFIFYTHSPNDLNPYSILSNPALLFHGKII